MFSTTRPLIASLMAAALAVACGSSTNPIAPSSSAAAGDAAADGSTLKVTAPELVSPVGGIEITDLDPDVVFRHSSALYLENSPAFQYDLEVYDEDDLLVYARALNPSAGDTTSHELERDLDENEVHTWRVRARLGEHVGPWSDVASFKTFLLPSNLPPGPYPGDGPGAVALVAATWPEYLVGTVTFGERTANMHFLRDRLIEIGRCGGLDLALNTKANGIISDDAITWKFGPTDGDVEVVDIALDWDNNDNDLLMHWVITEGPAGYTPLPNPSRCR